VSKLLGADGSRNRQTVRKQVPYHARAHAAIMTHSCYSLHLCGDTSDKTEMLIVPRSTSTNIFESGLSFTLVHYHLSHTFSLEKVPFIIFSIMTLTYFLYVPKENLGRKLGSLRNRTFKEESV